MKFKTLVKNNESFLKNAGISTVILGISALINYVFNIVMIRGLNAESFGVYSSALGIITLMQIPMIAISSAITKLIAENHDRNLKKFKTKIFLIFLAISVLISSIFFIFSPLVSKASNIPSEYMISLTAVLFLSFFGQIPKGILFGLDKPNSANLLNLFEAGIKIVLGIISVKISNTSIALPILASSIPFVFSLVFVFPFIGRKYNQSTEEVKGFINLKDTLLYSLLFLFLSSPYTLDASLVNPSFRPEYSALSLAEKVVYYAAISISSVMFSKIANLKGEKERKNVLWISIVIAGGVGIIVSLIYTFSPEVVGVYIFNNEYTEALKYLGVLGIGMSLYAVTYLIYNYFILINYIYSLIWIVITTVLQILLFVYRNNSLEQIVQNQMILYTVLFLGSIILLLRVINRKKMDDTGLEPVTSTM
jgi:O-antigen/teichoic acid export membrane protein